MEAVEALALVSGKVEKELLLRNEYLAVENEILKSKLNKPPRFNDHERIRLAKIGKQIVKGDALSILLLYHHDIENNANNTF